MFCALLTLPHEFQDPDPLDIHYTLCSTPHIKNIHYSSIFMILHTACTSLHEICCVASTCGLRNCWLKCMVCTSVFQLYLHGEMANITFHSPSNPMYRKSYRPDEVHSGEHNSITATLFSKKCICTELLCQSGYTLRKNYSISLVIFCLI